MSQRRVQTGAVSSVLGFGRTRDLEREVQFLHACLDYLLDTAESGEPPQAAVAPPPNRPELAQLYKSVASLSGQLVGAIRICRALAAGAHEEQAAELPASGVFAETVIAMKRAMQEQMRHYHDTSMSLALGLSDYFTVLMQMAEGDLRVAAGESTGEELLDQLGTSTNQMIASLRGLILDVQKQSTRLTSISQGVHRSAESGAASAEQIKVSINEVCNMAVAIADQLREAALSSSHSNALSQRGKEAMQDVLAKMKSIEEFIQSSQQSMEELNNSSREIADITSVLSEIASQTKFLSLNAAIEAARAGTAGKGFGVVADHIRNLADLSAQQASTISSVIRDVQKVVASHISIVEQGAGSVTAGMSSVEQCHSVFMDIASAAQALNARLDGIAASTRRTSSALSEATTAVGHLASIASEAAETAGELADNAQVLQGDIDKFSL